MNMRTRIVVAALLIGFPLGSAAGQEQTSELRDYLSANGLLNRGLYELAAKEYRTFLSEHEAHQKAPVARYGLAVCLYRLRDYPAATVELRKLDGRDEFPFAAEVRVMLGQCLLAQRKPAEAAKAFRTFLQNNKKHDLADDASAMLVEALYLDGKHEQALEQARLFERRWERNPLRQRVLFFAASAHMALEEWTEAAESLSSLLTAFPKSAFAEQAAFMLAQSYDQAGAFEKAARWYTKVLEKAKSRYVPDALLGLATLAERGGDFAKAGSLLDRLLNSDHEAALTPRAQLLRGRTWFEQEKYARAEPLFEKARKSDDEIAAEAEYWLAKCKLRTGAYKDSAARMQRALREHPKSRLIAEMRFDRAVALVRAGDDEAAAGALKEFRREHPQHEMAAAALEMLATIEHRAGDYEKSLVHCEKFATSYPDHKLMAEVAFLAAENEYLRGAYKQSLERYAAFLKRFPRDEQAQRARYRLGMAHYRLDQYDEAERFLSEAAEAAKGDPTFRSSLLALGDIQFQRGEWKRAEQRLSAYLAGDRDAPAADDALLKLGLAQQRQGRGADAVKSYSRLLETHPNSEHNLQAHFELGQAYVALERYDDATREFEQVLERGADSRFAAFALNHLGAIAQRRGDQAAAAEYFARVLDKSPEKEIEADALLQRGQALLATKRYAEAESVFDKMISEFPDERRTPRARAQRALAIARQERPGDALQAIEKLERSGMSSLDDALRTSIEYEKAWCLRKLDRTEDAAKAYRRILDSKTESVETAYALLELAELESAGKRWDSAVKLLERLRKLDAGPVDVPSDIRSAGLYRLGVCEFEREGFAKSAALLKEFIEKFGDHKLAASAGFFRGEALIKTDQQREAAECLTRVTESFKDDAVYGPSLLRLGEALATLQRWDRSERVFNAYLRKFSKSEFAYQAQFGIGWARENLKRYDEAIAAYRPVVDKHKGPTAARAQFQIGECLFAKKQLDEAVRELLKVDILYAYPEWSAAALYEAGRCFEQLGKQVEARRQYKRVRDKHGETRWAELAKARLAAVSGGTLPVGAKK